MAERTDIHARLATFVAELAAHRAATADDAAVAHREAVAIQLHAEVEGLANVTSRLYVGPLTLRLHGEQADLLDDRCWRIEAWWPASPQVRITIGSRPSSPGVEIRRHDRHPTIALHLPSPDLPFETLYDQALDAFLCQLAELGAVPGVFAR